MAAGRHIISKIFLELTFGWNIFLVYEISYFCIDKITKITHSPLPCYTRQKETNVRDVKDEFQRKLQATPSKNASFRQKGNKQKVLQTEGEYLCSEAVIC